MRPQFGELSAGESSSSVKTPPVRAVGLQVKGRQNRGAEKMLSATQITVPDPATPGRLIEKLSSIRESVIRPLQFLKCADTSPTD